MNHSNGNDHWLVRPKTIRLLWQIFIGVLVLTVLAQLFIHIKSHVGFDRWIGFGAVFGFLSCVAMVLVAKLLGILLKRRDNYYHNEEDDA